MGLDEDVGYGSGTSTGQFGSVDLEGDPGEFGWGGESSGEATFESLNRAIANSLARNYADYSLYGNKKGFKDRVKSTAGIASLVMGALAQSPGGMLVGAGKLTYDGFKDRGVAIDQISSSLQNLGMSQKEAREMAADALNAVARDVNQGGLVDPVTGLAFAEGDGGFVPVAPGPGVEKNGMSYLQRIQSGLSGNGTPGAAPNMTDPREDLWGHFLDQYFGVGSPDQEGYVPPQIERMLEGADFRRGQAEEYVEGVSPYREMLQKMVKESKPISFGMEGRPFKASFTPRRDIEAGQQLDQLLKNKLALADILDPSSSTTWTDYIGNLQGMAETERAGERGLQIAKTPYEKEFSFRDLMTDILLAGKGAGILKEMFF